MAGAALFLWPLIGLVTFLWIGPTRGLIWVTMVGYLFLPEAMEFDLPALPPYEKYTAIAVSLLLGFAATRDRLVAEQAPSVVGDHLLRLLLMLCIFFLILTPFMTWQTNPEVLVNGDHIRPFLSNRDAISALVETLVLFTPFFLAWRFLTHPDWIREMLVAMIILGLFYSFLVLFESRMSPQLNRWVYGYFQHSWIQHIRGGEFRPIVFLRHGLWVGFFIMTVVLAAFALSRPTVKRLKGDVASKLGRNDQRPSAENAPTQADGTRYFSDWEISRQLIPVGLERFQRTLRQNPDLPRGITQAGITWYSYDDLAALRAHFAAEGVDIPNAKQDLWRDRLPFLLVGIWTLCVLLVSRNLAASVLALGFSAMIFLAPQRIQLIAIILVTLFFASYPALKYYGSSPTERVLELAEKVSEERAQSFAFRLKHEGALISRAFEKPYFGWGGYARAQIYDDRGRNLTISDGLWIIVLGETGWVGYLSFFGLLILPTLFLRRAARRKEIPATVIGLAMISAANLIYMIPNSTLSPIGLLLFGAIAGFAGRDVATFDAGAPDPVLTKVRDLVPYTRFPGLPGTADNPAVRAIDPNTSAYRRRTPARDV